MKITHEVQISTEKDNFTNSREALSSLLKQNQIYIQDLKSDLELQNFQNLKNYPDYLVSLSHTKDAGAAVLGKKGEILSLGIDIEWAHRPLKVEASRYYKNQKDIHNESDIVLWTMKEAAFKALSPLYMELKVEGVLVLSKIVIQDGKFWSELYPQVRGYLESSLVASGDKQLIVTLASIPFCHESIEIELAPPE